VKIDIDEVGVILPGDTDQNPAAIPDEYWNAAGAMFAYLFGSLSINPNVNGVTFIGESQLVGYPTQFPSVSELDWNTGAPTARYWCLQLLIDHTDAGDQLFQVNTSNSDIFALGFQHKNGQREILLVNKLIQNTTITLQGINGGQITYTDTTTLFSPPVTTQFSSSSIALGGWSVAFVQNFS